MADLTSSQNQKKLSGLCYENTVIDRKGRIRKMKPPVAIKPRVPTQSPNLIGDNLDERHETPPSIGSLDTDPDLLNTRNILQVDANETENFHQDTKRSEEGIDNNANVFECYEPVWKQRPDTKHASNPEHYRQEVATTGQGITRNKQEVATAGQDITRNKQEIDTTGQDVTRNKQEVATTGQDITRNKQEVATAGQDISRNKQEIDTTGQDVTRNKQEVATAGQDITRNKQEVATTGQDITRNKQEVATTGQDIIRELDNYKEVLLKNAQFRFKVHKIQKHKIDQIENGVAAAAAKEEPPQKDEHIGDVYELALENLDVDDDDDDDDVEDGDDEDDDGSGRSLRSESPDTLVERILENIDGDGISIDFDGDTTPVKPPRRNLRSQQKSFSDEILERLRQTTQKSLDVAPKTSTYEAKERSRISTYRNETPDRGTARVPISEQRNVEMVRRHPELSSAAAAAVARLDRYIIDQEPISDAETKIDYAEPKVSEAGPKCSHAEPKSSHAEPNGLSVTTASSSSEDVVSQPTIADVPVASNLSHAAVQPSVTTVQLADSRLIRERSPEEVFEEIVEALRDTEGEYEDSFFLDWPALFPTPGKSPKNIGGLRTDGIPVDYSVENDWLSFFYSNRINITGEVEGGTAPRRRLSLEDPTQAVPNSANPAADSVGIFVNTSLSSSSSWMARTARGTSLPHTSLSKKPTSRPSEERSVAILASEQPEQLSLKSTEPVDVVIQSRGRPRSSKSEEQTGLVLQSNSGPSKSMPQNQPDLLPRPLSNLPTFDGQSSKENHLDFGRADQASNQNCSKGELPTTDITQSVEQAAACQDTDPQLRQATGEKIQDLNAEARFSPVDNPETVSSIAIETSPVLSAEPKSFPSDNPKEVSMIDNPQIDCKSDGAPTAVLFAALDAAFARDNARTGVESLKENDVDTDDDTDDTLTPKEDISQGIFLQSHCDASLNKQLLSPEPRDSIEDISRPENSEYDFRKVSGSSLKQSDGLHRSLEESKPQESQTEKMTNNVGTAAEEEKRLLSHHIIDLSRSTELGAIPNLNDEDASRKRGDESAEIGVDISEISKVSEAEKFVTSEQSSNNEKVSETDFQKTVANRHSMDPVTVGQPHPPKRVIKILSDEVTTQTVLLKIAWPVAKARERSRERTEQPFRELQLRRTIRMTDPGNTATQVGHPITSSVPLPSIKNHSHKTSTSGEPLNDKAVQPPSNDVANSNGIASSNDVVRNSETESQPRDPSSLATKPEFLVEYENQERSHNTEVTHDATVDVTQTDSVKVLLVPMETVYKVQDLKEIVAMVGKTILNDSRRIPIESNVRVTCEAVQSKSCAAVQDRDVTVIRNTILDTYNATNALPVKASTE